MTVFTFHLLGNAEALFNGFDAGGHQGLWETNGTAAGTLELTGINGASPSAINPTNFAVVRGASLFSLPEVLFSGTDASGHVGLWTTDGTSGGTSEITGIAGAGLSGISPSFTWIEAISGGSFAGWHQVDGSSKSYSVPITVGPPALT